MAIGRFRLSLFKYGRTMNNDKRDLEDLEVHNTTWKFEPNYSVRT